MNDHRDPESKLLAETFHGEWSEGAPAAFARAAAAHARRRRRLRRTAAVTGVCALVAVASSIAVRERPVPPPQIARTAEPKPAARGYEIISDEELLSQLRDRPLLVVKTQSGAKEFVLLEN